jgi:hypothetical protein
LKFSKSLIKFISMKYLPKDVHKLKDKELAEQLFPKKALEKIKEELEQPPKPKPRKQS